MGTTSPDSKAAQLGTVRATWILLCCSETGATSCLTKGKAGLGRRVHREDHATDPFMPVNLEELEEAIRTEGSARREIR